MPTKKEQTADRPIDLYVRETGKLSFRSGLKLDFHSATDGLKCDPWNQLPSVKNPSLDRQSI